jgi:transcriptional regulator with XRE-family HTH domain
LSLAERMAQLRNEIFLKKIVEKIKKLREQRGITQEKFYNDTNINIARIESTNANISISTFQAICKYLGVSASDFLKGM